MGLSYTTPLTVNGSSNLNTVLRTAGYTGNFKPAGEVVILNLNATPCYIHLTQDGATAPGTGTNGMPIGTDSSTAPSTSFSIPRGCDLCTTWLYTGSSISVKVSVNGGA
jgi:hypothetical protein